MVRSQTYICAMFGPWLQDTKLDWQDRRLSEEADEVRSEDLKTREA